MNAESSAKETPPGTREKLLEAAERITVREGVSRMALDAVSREAGVSKGGLFYHFPSKDALIASMIERFIERFERDIEENGVRVALRCSRGRVTVASQ